MSEKLSRRDLLQRTAVVGTLAALGAAAAACGKEKAPLSCNDTTGIAPSDVATRAALKYADVSVDPAKLCIKCQQWVEPPTSGACGTCKLLKGPVNPNGSCNAFAAKPT
jgi:hypothetical protein